MDSYVEMRRRLVEEMLRTNNEQRALLDKIEGEKREWTAEEFGEFTKRNAGLDDLESRVREIDKANKASATTDEFRAHAEQHIRPVGEPAPENDLDRRALDFFSGKSTEKELRFSFRGMRVQRDERTGRNVAVEARSGLNTLTGVAGDNLVPTGFRAVLYQHLIQNSAIRQTRATQMTTASAEPLVMPKTNAHPADGTIVAQGALIGESDPSFGQGTLNAYKYANLIQISSELEQDSGVDLLGYIAMAAARAIANGSGHAFITGTGTSQPQGVLVGAGTIAQTLGGTGQAGIPTYKELESVFDSIIPGYQQNAEWLMSQTTLSKLRQIVDGFGRPLWVPSLSGGMPDMLFGKPYYVDPYMPSAGTSSTSLAFGDFSTYFIRDAGEIAFERSLEYAFGNDLVTYRVKLRTDALLLDQTGSIGVYKGGTA